MIKFREVTRSLRWKLVKVLSPSIWYKYQYSHSNSLPRGSTMFAVDYFKDRPITYCEVGVNKGENVVDVISRLNVEHAYLIDMYEEYEEFKNPLRDEKTVVLTKEGQDEAFKIAKENLEPFKVTWILKYSDKAIEDLPDDIEFIYIDANHGYEYVKRDIELYWEKVADNGILAGHDFIGSFNGIINAVFEFASKNKLYIYSHKYDWWFVRAPRAQGMEETTND